MIARDRWAIGMRRYQADCWADSDERLMDKEGCLREAARRGDVNDLMIRNQLRIVEVERESRRHKEAMTMSDVSDRCRYPGCENKGNTRGLCSKHYMQADAREKFALPSHRGKRLAPSGAASPPAAAPPKRANGIDLVISIPRAEVTDDLAALLFRRGARVVQG